MQDQQNTKDLSQQNAEKILVVSAGHHTRLGDILEYALAGTAFDSVEVEAFLNKSWNNRKLLFALSAGETAQDAGLHALCSHLRENTDFLEGCVCAAIADNSQGRLAHLDLHSLLLAANQSGALVISRPLIEGDRELRFFSGGKESPFERYREQARFLVERLIAVETTEPEKRNLRLLTALESGTAHDLRTLLSRMAEFRCGELMEVDEPYAPVLLCENTQGLPDEKTLSLLDGGGKLRILLASPAMGGDLYIACLIERACLTCLTGNYALEPRGVLLFEGLSAMEVPMNRRETERVKAALTQ